MRSTLTLLIALAVAGCASTPSVRPQDRRPGGDRGQDPGPEAGGRGHRRLFISPVGEPFRTAARDPVRAWFYGADADHDGRLTADEFTSDALRFFAALDRGGDGEIDPDDVDFYENTLVPEVHAGGGGGAGRAGEEHSRSRGSGDRRGGGGMAGGGRQRGDGGGPAGGSGEWGGAVYADGQGAARFGFFDYPEPITVMDRNYNRGIDRSEMAIAAADRFHALDRNGDGVIERGELPRLAASATARGPVGARGGPPPARREDEAEPDTE